VAAVGLLLLVLVLALAQESGMVAYAPKLPAWLLPWLFANFFLTALPEEALFRHGLQRWLENRVEPLPALIAASLLFGAAHVAGGWGWVGWPRWLAWAMAWCMPPPGRWHWRRWRIWPSIRRTCCCLPIRVRAEPETAAATVGATVLISK
jgi:membrane protease YdiL (CAAX protease family)